MPSPHRLQAIEHILAARGRGHPHKAGNFVKSPAARAVLTLRPLPKAKWRHDGAKLHGQRSTKALALHEAREKGR